MNVYGKRAGGVFDQDLNTTDDVKFKEVEVGVGATSYLLPPAKGVFGQQMEQGPGKEIVWISRPGAQTYFTENASDTLFGSPQQYFPITTDVTWTAGELDSFTHANGRLTYSSARPPKTFHVTWNALIEDNNPSLDIRMGIFINNVLQPPSVVQCQTGQRFNNISGSALLILQPSDDVTIRVANWTSVQPISVVDANVTIVSW